MGTILHPARDGWGMAKVGQLYGVTHDIQAAGLLLQVVSLASLLALGTRVHARRDLKGWYAGLAGTLLWFALIIFDGSHNPVRAHYEPGLVHTTRDVDAGAAFIVFPALLIFPLGYLLLALTLRRHGMTGVAALLSVGSFVYTLGGLFIFTSGPRFSLIQIFEVAGAVLYALGYAPARPDGGRRDPGGGDGAALRATAIHPRLACGSPCRAQAYGARTRTPLREEGRMRNDEPRSIQGEEVDLERFDDIDADNDHSPSGRTYDESDGYVSGEGTTRTAGDTGEEAGEARED